MLYFLVDQLSVLLYLSNNLTLTTSSKESPMDNSMSPKQIKDAMDKKHIAQADIARELDVSPAAVSQVIKGTSTSHGIRLLIAEKIGEKVNDIWKVKPNPSKTGPR